MSIIITGDGVSRGICIGHAIVIYKDNIDQAPSFVSKNQVSKEAKKCLDVINKLKTEYKKSSSKIKNNPAITKLMNMQLSFVDDKSFRENVLKKINNHQFSASWAISSEYYSMKKSFERIEDKYIKERLIDIKQMIISLLELIQSRKELDIFSNDNIKNKIIITDEITPKDIIDIHHSKGLGVITSHGSRSSHSAILSKSLALPMLVKVESSINIIKNGDRLIMDPENQ